MTGAEGDQLQPLGARFEAARDMRGYADDVVRAQIVELILELDAAGAREHDVDLLRCLVAVREGMPLAGVDSHVGEPGGGGLVLKSPRTSALSANPT